MNSSNSNITSSLNSLIFPNTKFLCQRFIVVGLNILVKKFGIFVAFCEPFYSFCLQKVSFYLRIFSYFSLDSPKDEEHYQEGRHYLQGIEEI